MRTSITVVFGMAAAFSLAAHAKVDFVKEIQPILQNTCVECHGPEKTKGKLRLDNKGDALKTDSGVIVAGNPDESELLRRISLPPDHDDIMPPQGDPLSKEQVDLIRAWILEGAEWPDGVSLATADAKPEFILPEVKPTEGERQAIAKLAERGFSVRPIAMNVDWKETNLRLHSTNVTDEVLGILKDVITLVDLNLAGTAVTDQGLQSLAALTNLQRLHLENTAVTDAGLEHLKGLTNLIYLNLYGTAVSDKGIESLKGLGSLRRLYLWQTKVSSEGAEALKKALPELEISRGWEAKVAESQTEEEKKSEEKSGGS